eukprot:TRINITY_DN2289_c0_g1_i1.p1 TRINITY_DN2289_c0_g1~~TRINITY_DN2289_c0_g1_i1.p1  ORF type:complete len:171 (-),score=42.50 TRINITY_DN2289_c0_g1_i1:22-534(-)
MFATRKKYGDAKRVTLKVVKSDICEIQTDAIVHPTNGSLSLGGGVGNAISSKASPSLNTEINNWNRNNASLPTSGVCMTKAPGLQADHIIHVHSPSWGGDSSRKQLTQAVTNIFELAEKHKLTTVALPSIASGANRFPKHTAAAIILRGIQQYIENTDNSTIREVFFVLF